MNRTDSLLLWVSGMFPNWTLTKKMFWVVKMTCELDKLQRGIRERYLYARKKVRSYG